MKTFSMFAAGVLLAGAALAQPATGGFTGTQATARGGFTGPATVVTVEHAKTLRDDTPVTLRGTIERHTGGENYVFKDTSGTVEVEIDERIWQGQTVSPQDTVEISGEVDHQRHRNTVEIDVKRLRKL